MNISPKLPLKCLSLIWCLVALAACTTTHKPTQTTDPQAQSNTFTIDLSIVGDCLLATDRGLNYAGSFNWYAEHRSPGYFFEKVKPIFERDDFTIVNLENVLTDNELDETLSDSGNRRAYCFKAPTRHSEILKAGSIEAVSLANNHTNDYGPQGYADTIATVKQTGLAYGTENRTIYLKKNGFVIAVICHGLWYEAQASQIIRRIKEASKHSDYQIVFYHGGAEAVHHPEPWRVRASRRLVDAGADLVIGNHPHVLQPMEVYNGVNIVYSLGNFCFGGNTRPENRTVIYRALLTITEGRIQKQETNLIPCYVFTGPTNNWQPTPILDTTAKQLVLDFMYGKRELPYQPLPPATPPATQAPHRSSGFFSFR